MAKKQQKKFANGGWWDEALLGMGSGAATGAGVGTLFGPGIGTAIGTGIGALVGFTSSAIKANKAQTERNTLEREQARLERKNRLNMDNAQLSQYDTQGSGLFMAAQGGKFIPLASNAAVAKGATHEEGGIKVQNAELENNETVINDHGVNKVISDDMGFAAIVNPLMAKKGSLEQDLYNTTVKLANYDTAARKDSDKHKVAGYQRKIEAYSKKGKDIESEIASIDKIVNDIFQQQQSLNGDASNSNSEQVPQMKLGGKLMQPGGTWLETPELLDPISLKKSNGVPSIPWNTPKTLDVTDIVPKFKPNLFQNTSRLINTGIDNLNSAMKNNPNLTSGLLTSAGNYLSNLKNKIALSKIEVPKPRLGKAYTQDASINVSGSMAALDEQSNRLSDFINKNVANTTVARAIMAGDSVRTGTAKAKILQDKENIESQIQGQNLANIQQTEAQNLAKLAQYDVDKFNQQMATQGIQSQIDTALVSDIKESIGQNRMEDYQKMQLRLQALTDIDDIMKHSIMMAINNNMTEQEFEAQLKKDGITNTNKHIAAFRSLKSLG